jgi:hypothetical protein
MPVPDFNHNRVLPPHLGDPRLPTQLSPFPVTASDVCAKLATSDERREILRGWLLFREQLSQLGITEGFQWLDGSFVEEVEISEARPPKDLDIVTFYFRPLGMKPLDFMSLVQKDLPEFLDRDLSKKKFKLDHFPITLSSDGKAVVEQTRYWTGLFSHRRDGVWKGILRVELNTPIEDIAAAVLLQPAPTMTKP